MKKIICICLLFFTYHYCAFATTYPQPPQKVQSLIPQMNNTSKDELAEIQTLSTNKTKDALAFQDAVIQAAQNHDQIELQALIHKMKKFVEDFNQDLDALTLKSPEANSIRSKIKQINNLGIKLSEEAVKDSPDLDNIKALQAEINELQQLLSTEIIHVQNKIDIAK